MLLSKYSMLYKFNSSFLNSNYDPNMHAYQFFQELSPSYKGSNRIV